jgi:hypothetical protein
MIFGPQQDTYCMKRFWEWIARTSPLPESDKVLALIRQAGPQGIARGSLGSQIKLEKKTLDELLAALVRFNQIVATREGEYIVYRIR